MRPVLDLSGPTAFGPLSKHASVDDDYDPLKANAEIGKKIEKRMMKREQAREE